MEKKVKNQAYHKQKIQEMEGKNQHIFNKPAYKVTLEAYVIFLSEKLSGKIAISAEGLSIEELKSIIETAEQLYANLQNNILPHVQKLLLEG